MIEIVNKLLFAGDTYMPEKHLRQPGFNYSAYGPFSKNKERIKKFKETGDEQYIYRKELSKACFQYDTAYGDFKDLARRTASDKVLRVKAYNVAKNPKYDGYQKILTSKSYFYFKTSGIGVNNEIKQNQQLAEELHKPIIKKK